MDTTTSLVLPLYPTWTSRNLKSAVLGTGIASGTMKDSNGYGVLLVFGLLLLFIAVGGCYFYRRYSQSVDRINKDDNKIRIEKKREKQQQCKDKAATTTEDSQKMVDNYIASFSNTTTNKTQISTTNNYGKTNILPDKSNIDPESLIHISKDSSTNTEEK